MYMSGAGYYTQIQYLTVCIITVTEVHTLAAVNTRENIRKHILWFGVDLYTEHMRSS